MTDPVDSGFITPDYGRRSLGEVLPAIGAALGKSALHDPGWELPDAPSYVVLLVDGMGAELLRRHPTQAPYLSSLIGRVPDATAGTPSTTATSLTSLGTALSPGEHGILGYTTRVPESGVLLNALHWDRRVDPNTWQPNPTAFERLSTVGVSVSVVSKREFAGSGLSVASQRGADYVGVDRVGERVAATVRATDEMSLTYVYDGDLDWVGHRHGVDSDQWRHQLAAIDSQAHQLREALPPATRLVVIADHGMVDCPKVGRVDIDRVPEMRFGLAMLGGEARFRHLYAEPGAAEDLIDTWRGVLGETAVVLPRDEAIALGWFGEVSAAFALRIGDVVVASTGNAGVFSSVNFKGETKLIGIHGSLTPDEMLIPVLID